MTTSILLLAMSSYTDEQLAAAIVDTRMVLGELLGREERECEMERLEALNREVERRRRTM